MNQKLLKMKLKKSIDDYADQFTSCIEKNVIDKDFLEAVLIPFWELQYWCKEFTIPFPEFWISPMWRGESYIPLPGVPRPSNASVLKDDTSQETDTGQQAATEDSPDTEPSTSIDSAVSERSRKAAFARHEPISQIKRELVKYWEGGEFKNQVEAVRKFYNTLPTEKQRLLSADHWEVTLSKALSDHINDRSAPWRSKLLSQ
ncbi:MAG: hypothetical protein KJ958_03280 [Gammaproteobacteria bacterium]|nr:hypothetical protein [Gammaproteobacteria bacterium]MBU1978171.1 hypothetical protein [Gammaproteobacteria bacterium]